MSDSNTHVDNVKSNLDGSITVVMDAFMNPAVAASFAGATVTGTVVNAGGGTVRLTIQVAPITPIVQQTTQSDDAGSESA